MSVTELVNGIDPHYSSCVPNLSRQASESDLGYEQMLAPYSGWKSVRNYDKIATGFGGLYDGFMSLISYFDVK